MQAFRRSTHHLDEAEQLCSHIGIMRNGRIVHDGTVPELLALVPAKAIALLETTQESAVRRRAAELGWGVRSYAGKLGCLLPQQASLREVVEAFSDVEVSSVSVQPVSLEHAYLEVIHSQTLPPIVSAASSGSLVTSSARSKKHPFG